MRTTKPISTISFNSEEYLQGILKALIKARMVTLWHYIKHQPEDDEGGNKEHFHVYIEPSKLLQTEDLRDQFKEYDPQKPDKPKGCLPFRNSRFDSWYMYAIHDKAFLASKMEERRYHYKESDVKTSDEDMLRYQVRMIDLLALSPYQKMVEAMDNGATFEEFLSRGSIPIPQLSSYQFAWNALLNARNGTSKTDRGEHVPHVMNLNDEEQEFIIQMRVKKEQEKRDALLYGKKETT